MQGKVLAPNWEPSVHDLRYGYGLGLDDAAIAGMAEDMRLWAGANENRAVARKSNWSMAFKGWMRREARKMGKTNGTRPLTDAFAELRARAGGDGEEGAFALDLAPPGD